MDTPKKRYNKVVVGYVVQEFTEQEDGKSICTRQMFCAGDEVTYENMDGDITEIDETKEVYFNMEMVQPKTGQIDIPV